MESKGRNIHTIIEKLRTHYLLFINNEFIKYYLLDMKIPKSDWVEIEDLVASNKYYKTRGYDFNKLYEQTLTFFSFLIKLKKK